MAPGWDQNVIPAAAVPASGELVHAARASSNRVLGPRLRRPVGHCSHIQMGWGEPPGCMQPPSLLGAPTGLCIELSDLRHLNPRGSQPSLLLTIPQPNRLGNSRLVAAGKPLAPFQFHKIIESWGLWVGGEWKNPRGMGKISLPPHFYPVLQKVRRRRKKGNNY